MWLQYEEWGEFVTHKWMNINSGIHIATRKCITHSKLTEMTHGWTKVCVFTLTLFIRKWVWMWLWVKLFNWLIVEESCKSFLVFSCLCHGMARYNGSPKYTNFAVSFRLPHARKPLPRLHDKPNFFACSVISQHACLFSFTRPLCFPSCAFRSVFREKIWQSIWRVEKRECRYGALIANRSLSIALFSRLDWRMVWNT